MRACATVVAAILLAACGPEPTCVDDEGEELPVCVYGEDNLEFCPGDNWAATDDTCNTCACFPDGEWGCTEVPC